MIKNLPKQFFLALCISLFGLAANAQVTVTVNPSAPWLGFMNVFDLGGGYQFGSPWGLPDVKTTLDVPGNQVILQPNYNTYNAADAYWSNGPIGNKIMEANTFVEPTGTSGQTLTFEGNVNSNTLITGYTANAFIKVLDPAQGFATTVNQAIPLPASGLFSVSAAIPNDPTLIVQYGFVIVGLNANPINEAAYGSISVGPAAQPLSLSLNTFEAKANSNIANLTWNTINESNATAFEVEKSLNAKDFTKVGSVAAKNVANASYNFNDAINNTVAYYRLKMINNNGTYNYSKVVAVNNSIQASVVVYPNPSSSELNIVAQQGLGALVIVNTTGAIVKSLNITDNNTRLDISGLNKGIYFIKSNNATLATFEKQ